MKLSDTWRFSKQPYIEVTYRSTMLTRGGMGGGLSSVGDPRKRVNSIIRGAKISKIVFAFFMCLGSVAPLLQYPIDRTAVSLAAAVTFSLAISLAYLVLYSLQVLPSFSSAEPFALLSSLPLEDRDFSLVTMFSFIRTFDYLAVSAVATQVVAIAFVTGSAVATVLMAVAALMNMVFAVAIGLGFSRLFYRNITRGGRSRGAALSRIVFLITWGFATMSTGFLFSLIGTLLPIFAVAFAGGFSQSMAGVLLSVLHPFSIALLVAGTVYPQFLSTAVAGFGGSQVLILVAVAGYALLAVAAGRRTLRVVSGIAHGQGVAVVRHAAKEFLVKVRSPVFAYIVKDLRVASKTPSTAIIFALPIFEILIIGLNTSAFSNLTATSVLSVTLLGCFFTLFASSVLLNTEGAGLDYTLSLPLGPAVIIDAKSLVATVAYVPVPFAITALLAFKGSTSGILALIPFVQVPAVAAATAAQLSFFIRGYRKKSEGQGARKTKRGQSALQASGFSMMSGGDLVRMGESLLVAAGFILAPMGTYGFSYLALRSHLASLSLMVVVAVAELAAVQALVRRR